ncbi:MAG: VanZ family protein [Bacilli bacterium]
MVSKKIFRLCCIIVWLILIFWFSNQPGNVSKKQSEDVITTFVEIVSDKNEDEKDEIVKDYTFITRKAAHFLEYFILAILIIRFVTLYDIKYFFIISLVLCIVVASCDEFHQYFILERECRVMDVVIDTSGSLLGIGCYILIKKKN